MEAFLLEQNLFYFLLLFFISFFLLSLACVGECFFFASMPTLKLLASMSEGKTEFFFFFSCKPKTEGPINRLGLYRFISFA